MDLVLAPRAHDRTAAQRHEVGLRTSMCHPRACASPGDLVVLAKVLHGCWAQIAGRTMLTEADLTTASGLASMLLASTGVKENGGVDGADMGKDHQRAFTLLVRTYEQVRRAIQFLRFDEGDAEEITPSMFQRASSPRKPAEGNAADAGTANGTPNVAPNGNGHAPTPTVAAPAIESAPIAKTVVAAPARATTPTATTPSPLPPGSSVKEGGPFTE